MNKKTKSIVWSVLLILAVAIPAVYQKLGIPEKQADQVLGAVLLALGTLGIQIFQQVKYEKKEKKQIEEITKEQV